MKTKILWVVNVLFDYHRNMMGVDTSKVTGASWLYAALEGSKRNPDIELHIVTVGKIQQAMKAEHDGNYYYILPGGGRRDYDYKSEANKKSWCELIEELSPDLAVIWGTECPFAYLAMTLLKGTPMAIYMQGVMDSIVTHYYEGVPHKYICNTFRDIIDRFNKASQIRSYQTQVGLEREMFRMADAVIVENDWCEDMCKSANPHLRVFRNKLPIREVFFEKQWELSNIERHTIFSNSGGYPIKGHHILFQALAIVKEKYPDVKCFLPGYTLQTFMPFRRKTGYMKFLESLINDNGLQDNVVYTGSLTSEQMVDYLVKSHIYVMPSIMENHSSSLIEAMVAGAPCVSSLVGGTASLVQHKRNGILYNSLDYKSLAGNIIRLFEDDELASAIGHNALGMREERKQDFGAEMNAIYSEMQKGKSHN